MNWAPLCCALPEAESTIPRTGSNGVIKDICIADGRVVEDVSGGRTIDATGLVVFPGGVDVHTHVAGGSVNFAAA